ncbi:MAG: hypothetical protein AB1521_01605 [Bacteroidota bacterium]
MKKNILPLKIIFSLLFLLTSQSVLAQWSLSFSTGQEYNDNPFHSPFPESNLISNYDVNVTNENDLISFGYLGSYFALNNNPERNFQWHQLSIWKYLENLSFNISYDQRFGKQYFSFLDYLGFEGNINYKIPTDYVYSQIYSTLSYTKFNELSTLDNFTAAVGFEVNKGFETGTTIITGAKFNYRTYSSDTYIIQPDNSASDSLIIIGNEKPTPIPQLTSYIRAAQSLTESTGLAVQYSNRSILGEVKSVFLSGDFYLWEESEIFDDPLKYEGNTALAELTQLVDDFTIKAGYYLNKKNYPSQGIYTDYENFSYDLMRSDTQQIFNISLRKNSGFTIGSTELNFSLSYQYINNKSNSTWFNYKSSSFMLNLDLSF